MVLGVVTKNSEPKFQILLFARIIFLPRYFTEEGIGQETNRASCLGLVIGDDFPLLVGLIGGWRWGRKACVTDTMGSEGKTTVALPP